MNIIYSLFIFAVAVGLTYFLMRGMEAARLYYSLRGKRLITCPENKLPEAVDIAAKQVALQAVFGQPHLRLSDCSRWPEMAGCGQECLRQIEANPEGCLVWNIVDRWYVGKKCAYCHTQFDHIHWHDHPPALCSPEGITVQWYEIAPEQLPAIFATYQPVCWNCHIAETFRRQHPELVTDRDHRHVA
ncbi:MAG: hypothetical protein HY046_11120 [Acidobacteria bacterium]|nr:hypothetical protein [Acidobacteriota bacterium]